MEVEVHKPQKQPLPVVTPTTNRFYYKVLLTRIAKVHSVRAAFVQAGLNVASIHRIGLYKQGPHCELVTTTELTAAQRQLTVDGVHTLVAEMNNPKIVIVSNRNVMDGAEVLASLRQLLPSFNWQTVVQPDNFRGRYYTTLQKEQAVELVKAFPSDKCHLALNFGVVYVNLRFMVEGTCNTCLRQGLSAKHLQKDCPAPKVKSKGMEQEDDAMESVSNLTSPTKKISKELKKIRVSASNPTPLSRVDKKLKKLKNKTK